MKSIQKVICLLTVVSLQTHLTPNAWSWGDIGHGAVGYIAEKNLTPAAQALVHKILGPEPLLISAVWPDHARSDPRFKPFSSYHFVEIPEGTTYDKLSDAQKAPMSAHTIVSQVPQLLVGNTINRDQKMILLRYLVHVVGDIHQPLHVGNGVDMGANLCDVKWTDPQSGQLRSLNLHTVWDENLILNIADEFQKSSGVATGGKRWFGDKEMGDVALAFTEKEITYASANAGDLLSWYAETRALHSLVYPDATPVKEPAERSYCKMVHPESKKIVDGNYKADKVPTLEDSYVQRALPIIKKQIALGGYRLAGILNKVAESANIKPLKKDTQKNLLDKILIKNPGGRAPQSVDTHNH